MGTATANSGAIPALDTTSFPVTLPFGFVFNGQNYTAVTVSSNGYITFGTGTATGTAPISSTVAYDGAVSAWGANILAVFNIVGKTGNMSWTVEGTAPNRVAVFQWENFRPSSSTSTTAAYAFSFQIRLAETTNVVSTVYSTGGNLIGTTAFSGTTVQIGLRGTTNSDFNNRTNAATVNFGSSTSGTSNSSGQAFNTVNTPPGMPADGLTYTWTPPTCLKPSVAGVSAITTSSATLAWTASSSAPASGYEVYYSTTNVAPDNTTTPSITGITGLTTTLFGLTFANTYYVWVRAKCSATDFSSWSESASFSTPCMPPAVLSTTGATVCPNNTATLNATTDPGATLHWLDSTGTEVGTGPSFITPSLAATTTYFVNASVGLNGVPVGKNTYSPSPTSGAGTTNFGLVFDVLAPFTINSVTIYPVSASSASGTVIIDVIDAGNTVVHSVTAAVTGAPLGSPVAQVVNLGFYMQAGTNYKMRPRSYTGISGLLFDPSATAPNGNYGYPFTYPGVLSSASVKWYDALTGGNLLATGPTYTTPVITSSTNYYVAATTGTSANVGKVGLESNASTGGGLSSYLLFDALSDFTLNTVDLFPYSATAGTAGTVTITLRSSTGTLLNSATVNVTGANSVATSVAQTVTLNFPIIGGQSYRLGVSAWTGVTNLYRDATNLAFPYSLPGIVDITGGSLATPYYYFFYNWNVLSGCESARTVVTATYDPTCTMGTSEAEDGNIVSIYPNPFTDVVSFSEIKNVTALEITDASGRLVKTIKPAKEIYLGELKAGMYFIKLKMKDGTSQNVKALKK